MGLNQKMIRINLRLLSKEKLAYIRYFLIYILLFSIFGCASIPQVENANVQSTKESSTIEWRTSFKDASADAIAKNKSMMLVFYGLSSKRLDDNVFSSPDVIKLAQEFVCLKLGSDQNELTKRYKVFEFPTVLFTDA